MVSPNNRTLSFFKRSTYSLIFSKLYFFEIPWINIFCFSLKIFKWLLIILLELNVSSLENLIHHILFEEELYNEFLNNRQLNDCSKVVKEHPDSIYRPNLENEEISDREF